MPVDVSWGQYRPVEASLGQLRPAYYYMPNNRGEWNNSVLWKKL